MYLFLQLTLEQIHHKVSSFVSLLLPINLIAVLIVLLPKLSCENVGIK